MNILRHCEFHENDPNEYVRNGDLAKKLGVKPASATEMVQRLANKGFLNMSLTREPK